MELWVKNLNHRIQDSAASLNQGGVSYTRLKRTGELVKYSFNEIMSGKHKTKTQSPWWHLF